MTVPHYNKIWVALITVYDSYSFDEVVFTKVLFPLTIASECLIWEDLIPVSSYTRRYWNEYLIIIAISTLGIQWRVENETDFYLGVA